MTLNSQSRLWWTSQWPSLSEESATIFLSCVWAISSSQCSSVLIQRSLLVQTIQFGESWTKSGRIHVSDLETSDAVVCQQLPRKKDNSSWSDMVSTADNRHLLKWNGWMFSMRGSIACILHCTDIDIILMLHINIDTIFSNACTNFRGTCRVLLFPFRVNSYWSTSWLAKALSPLRYSTHEQK